MIRSMDELAQAMRRAVGRATGYTDYAHNAAAEAAISVVRDGFEFVEVEHNYRDGDWGRCDHWATEGLGWQDPVARQHILVPGPAPEPKPDVREAAIRAAEIEFATSIEYMEKKARALRAALDAE